MRYDMGRRIFVTSLLVTPNALATTGAADISEGMHGARRAPGWLAAGLPRVSLEAAFASLPEELA